MDKKTLYRIYQIVLAVLYIALMVFFVVKCLENGTKSSNSSEKVAEVTAEVINGVAQEEKVDPKSPTFQQWIRKFIGHYGFFVVLGTVSIFLYLSFSKLKSYVRILLHYIIGIGFAISTEFILEANTQGRGPSWKDVGIDSLGFLTISLLVVIGYYIFTYKRKKASS